MQTTFALRRNEIINDELPVGEILERWPALKMESKVEQSDDPDIEDIAVGLLMINARSTDTTLFCPERIAVVIEGNRVIKLPTLADAFILLFALTFALHLSYPKDLANTLTSPRKCWGLDEGNLKNLKPRVLSLKNELLAV
ncbi:Vacuolar protein sorting-associated protein 13B [Dissostichus eleginoides]|uniref:Vacuolar protein sorting-associated protein 13B n=1 Tax=Dissostichus eleginoides TaxID=100907 RepID=A0AAD9CCR4_DISEL|nr:Vacuolar protein sorting-associated protein 13B [Dissostichus eleginoides]